MKSNLFLRKIIKENIKKILNEQENNNYIGMGVYSNNLPNYKAPAPQQAPAAPQQAPAAPQQAPAAPKPTNPADIKKANQIVQQLKDYSTVEYVKKNNLVTKLSDETKRILNTYLIGYIRDNFKTIDIYNAVNKILPLQEFLNGEFNPSIEDDRNKSLIPLSIYFRDIGVTLKYVPGKSGSITLTAPAAPKPTNPADIKIKLSPVERLDLIKRIFSKVDGNNIIQDKNSYYNGKKWPDFVGLYTVTDEEIKLAKQYVNIIKWQTTLKNAGLYDGPIDGKWGPKTDAGYKKYKQLETNPAQEKQAPESTNTVAEPNNTIQSKIPTPNANVTGKENFNAPQVSQDPGAKIFNDNLNTNLSYRNPKTQRTLIWKGPALNQNDLNTLNEYLKKGGYVFKKERDKGEGNVKYKWVRQFYV